MTTGSNGSTLALADTNVLLYAVDLAEPVKRPIADSLLKELIRDRRLALSVQNLNEFYNIATRPNRPFTMDRRDAVDTLRALAATCRVFPITAETAFRALDAADRYRMSLWDALIWSVAKEQGVGLIYTEDSQSAPEIDGVRYINPFG
jgi:predicted nucleic acid-binding protein